MSQIDTLIDRAAQRLHAGELVAFPTETVYGLGAAAENDRAVAAVYSAKGRPEFNPLIVHAENMEAAWREVHANARAQILAEAFWPGPLTLVLPRRADSKVSLLASAGLDTLAVRVPAHPTAQHLLQVAGIPLVAPSANKSGRVSPTAAAHVYEEFGDAIMILDGGACRVGVESTIIDVSGDTPVILRSGSITKELVEACLGEAVLYNIGDAILAPGMLKSHYAPHLPVRLNARDVFEGEALLAFGEALPGAAHVLNLSESSNLEEAASHLFAYLRELDKPSFAGIAVMPIPMDGLGVAINDRLSRAAADR